MIFNLFYIIKNCSKYYKIFISLYLKFYQSIHIQIKIFFISKLLIFKKKDFRSFCFIFTSFASLNWLLLMAAKANQILMDLPSLWQLVYHFVFLMNAESFRQKNNYATCRECWFLNDRSICSNRALFRQSIDTSVP